MNFTPSRNFFNFLKISIYFWLCCIFIAAWAFLQLWCTGFSLSGFCCCRAWAQGHTGFSSCGSQAQKCRLNSCGEWTYLLLSMWDLPGLTSPALAGRSFTTEPPRKPLLLKFFVKKFTGIELIYNVLLVSGIQQSESILCVCVCINIISSLFKILFRDRSLSRVPCAMQCKCQPLSRVQLFVTPWTVARQAPLSMRFPRQEYCSGQTFSSPGDLPGPGIKPRFPALQADSLLSESPVWLLGNVKYCMASVICVILDSAALDI